MIEKIETKRLILRKFQLADAEDMFTGWAADFDNIRFLTFPPHPNIEESKCVITRWIDCFDDNISEEKSSKEKVFAIFHRMDEKVIGSIGVKFHKVAKCLRATVGYCLSKAYWNNGYTTEALKSLIEVLFKEMNVNRIEAIHDVENVQSGKVMQKAGLNLEGILKSYSGNHTNPVCDVAMRAITQEEWQKQNLKNGDE